MILVDQNLSPSLVWKLKNQFQGIVHVRDLGFATADDLVIWEFASKNGFTVLTKDNDFRHIQAVRGFPPKVIQLMVGNCSTREIIKRLTEDHGPIIEFLRNNRFGLLEIWGK